MKKDEEKKEVLEPPKMLNLDGEEINESDLEDVAGGLAAPGDCNTGGCCSGS